MLKQWRMRNGECEMRNEVRAMRAWCERGMVWIELADGRQIGVPADKFPRLRKASEQDLAKVRVEARGKALRWEELDEDLLVEGVVAGRFPNS